MACGYFVLTVFLLICFEPALHFLYGCLKLYVFCAEEVFYRYGNRDVRLYSNAFKGTEVVECAFNRTYPGAHSAA